MKIDEILSSARVIPVLDVADPETVAPLAKALQAGGLRVAELTLRAEHALQDITVMKDAAAKLTIGMGTIRSIDDIDRSISAGADFLASPGASPSLLAAMAGAQIPALPGVATASEAMIAFEAGFRHMKFFPTEAAGGISYLQALAGPLPDIRFCPTGGVSAENAPAYLALPNVTCVGGSWIASREMVAKGDWEGIERAAARAASIGRR